MKKISGKLKNLSANMFCFVAKEIYWPTFANPNLYTCQPTLLSFLQNSRVTKSPKFPFPGNKVLPFQTSVDLCAYVLRTVSGCLPLLFNCIALLLLLHGSSSEWLTSGRQAGRQAGWLAAWTAFKRMLWKERGEVSWLTSTGTSMFTGSPSASS